MVITNYVSSGLTHESVTMPPNSSSCVFPIQVRCPQNPHDYTVQRCRWCLTLRPQRCLASPQQFLNKWEPAWFSSLHSWFPETAANWHRPGSIWMQWDRPTTNHSADARAAPPSKILGVDRVGEKMQSEETVFDVVHIWKKEKKKEKKQQLEVQYRHPSSGKNCWGATLIFLFIMQSLPGVLYTSAAAIFMVWSLQVLKTGANAMSWQISSWQDRWCHVSTNPLTKIGNATAILFFP